MKFMVFVTSLAIVFMAGAVQAAESIKDNSFLIEEAYNQEAGVVQFIQSYQYMETSKNWTYNFTNEIPITDETHQFSYVIPVLKQTVGTTDETQIGDVLLNYRYQLMNTQMLSHTSNLGHSSNG